MGGMVAYTDLALDDGGYARQPPQICAETVGARATRAIFSPAQNSRQLRVGVVLRLGNPVADISVFSCAHYTLSPKNCHYIMRDSVERA